MTLNHLKLTLLTAPDAELNLTLPNKKGVAAHFHLTEIGLEKKDFIDCGGTRRQLTRALLQILVSTDTHHRFPTRKLITIIDRALTFFPELADTPVHLEVQGRDSLERYRLKSVLPGFQFLLAAEATACLAQDSCAPGDDLSTSLPATGSCDASSGCC